MIFPVWQSLGGSTHLLAQACGTALGEAATHTGTLDPMAEGVVVILTGDDRFAKGQLQDWKKTYRFSILWGACTDSLDQLGIVTDQSINSITVEDISAAISQFPLVYLQTTPKFSAQRWNGKSGFDLAKAQQPLVQKTREVELSELTILGSEFLSSEQVLEQHRLAITEVHGDFRQDEVLESWNASLAKSEQFLITHHSVVTSPGTYIRQLVQDLENKFQTPATTWLITRVKNGPYERQDCVEVNELEALA
jgi:tRNA pseudouridine(55) synthase